MGIYPVLISADDADTGWILKDSVDFGFLIADIPTFEIPESKLRMIDTKALHDTYPDSAVTTKHYTIYHIPPERLTPFISDRVGDTVLVVTASRKVKAVIDGFINHSAECGSNVIAGKLRLLEEFDDLPHSFLVLRNELANYEGPIIPFKKYELTDAGCQTQLNPVLYEFIRTYKSIYYWRLKNRPSGRNLQRTVIPKSNPFYKIYISAYGPEQKDIPDTLILSIVGSYGSTEGWWSSLCSLFKNGNGWRIQTYKKPGYGGFVPTFYFAIDLNGDGIREYFIGRGGTWRLIQITGNKIVYLDRSGNYGC